MLESGATWAGDYPRGYQVQVSSDGTNWTTVTSGIGTGQSLLIQFQVQVARYLKIVQTGTSGNWWSIAELNVYGEQENSRSGFTSSASSTESAASPATSLHATLNTP